MGPQPSLIRRATDFRVRTQTLERDDARRDRLQPAGRAHTRVERPFVDALVRGLSGMFSIAALGIGCLWMINDPERQTWHDKIAGALVVKVPRDLVLP